MFVDHHHHPQFQHIMIPSPQCIYVPLSVKDVCPPLPVYKKCLSPGGHTGGGQHFNREGGKTILTHRGGDRNFKWGDRHFWTERGGGQTFLER